MAVQPAVLNRPIATTQDTIAALLKRSRRKAQAVPIRRTFVQQGEQSKPQPGPLAGLVRNRDERALDLYLLVHAIASADPWDVTLPSAVWARTQGLSIQGSAESAVSKVWGRLEKHNLISRKRTRRAASVTLLAEDGSGNPYRHPGGVDTYFKLSYQYWLADEEWYRTLGLAAKAVLLIALTLPSEFILPAQKAAAWYGLSTATAGKGLRALRKSGLLAARKEFKKAPLAPLGYTEQLVYSLQGPFRRAPRP